VVPEANVKKTKGREESGRDQNLNIAGAEIAAAGKHNGGEEKRKKVCINENMKEKGCANGSHVCGGGGSKRRPRA